MARPIRLEFAGALYHVTARGDRREAIYEDDADREQFLSLLGDVVELFNWRCHAYCLMTNHYHLVVETPDANLSKGMRQLNGVFTQWSNRRHRRNLKRGHPQSETHRQPDTHNPSRRQGKEPGHPQFETPQRRT